MPLSEALVRFGSEGWANSRAVWPKNYIDGKARKVVSARTVNIREGLAGTGIKLIEPPKPRKQQYSCEGCGRFMAQEHFWSGDCGNCGADSRP